MLMQERLIALNDVVVACQDAARQYDAYTDRLADTELVALFRTLVDERESLARRLSAHVRELGELPREPDVELEQVQQLVSRLKASLSVDERLTILDERIDCEQQIEAVVATAERFEWTSETTECLRAARQGAARAGEQLRAHRQSLRDG